jgi:prepilin-type N-terminal cleavage/methylation domain-containing protein
MSKNTKSRGFTLIELLVVIAIIGILSAIVLASLSTARNKENDAKIEGQMDQIRAAAEIYSSNNGTSGYTGLNSVSSSDTSGLYNLEASSTYPGGVSPTWTSAVSSTVWVAWHQLSSNTNYWCVDNSGNSKLETSAPGAAVTACP